MNTFTSNAGDAGKVPAIPAAAPSSGPLPAKQMDANAVYMLFEEMMAMLKKIIETPQKSAIDPNGSILYDPEVMQKVLSKELPKITMQLQGQEIDYSKIPKPVDYSQKLKDIESKVESKDTETAKKIGALETDVIELTKAVNSDTKVKKVEKTIRIAKESWQWYLCMGLSIITTLLALTSLIWQEGRIDECRVSDIKYHFIMMHGGVGPEGLDSIESWFRDPERVKQIEGEVKAYEERVQETARALEQKYRLEEKLKELNSVNNSKPTKR